MFRFGGHFIKFMISIKIMIYYVVILYNLMIPPFCVYSPNYYIFFPMSTQLYLPQNHEHSMTFRTKTTEPNIGVYDFLIREGKGSRF